jgi:SpoVK/Ycf46/Vps4 family AAA+-type ATPase
MLESSVSPAGFLNLMDGIAAKNGLFVIATANNVRKLKANITQRPSRFDRKIEIPPPTFEMAHIYLQKWFGNILPPPKTKGLAEFAAQHQLSYAYLKELYISSMFEALSRNRKTPTAKDIYNTLARLIKDKNLLNDTEINTDRYFT